MIKASTSRLILSISLVMASLWLQGCSSMSTGSQDGVMNIIMSSTEPGRKPWDPEQGYGARIPNMQGDWTRFCEGKKGIEPACR